MADTCTHERKHYDDMDDRRHEDQTDDCAKHHHVDESKTMYLKSDYTTPEAKWPPQIFPPPEGTHLGCPVCQESYHSTKMQEVSISLSSPGNRTKWPLYNHICTDDAAQHAIDVINKRIGDALSHVKDTLELSRDLVLSRWTKKSKDKRGKLLHTAAGFLFGTWPRPRMNLRLDLTEEEFAIFGPMSLDTLSGSGKGGPSINIEEFAEDRMKLLSLLAVRISYASCDRAMFDSRGMLQYFWAPTEPLSFNSKCVKMLGKEYGRLTELDVEAIHTGTALGFPRAWATFCVQYHIAAGLRNLVNMVILGGTPSGNLKPTKLVSDGLHSSIGGARWGTYDNQAFAPPITLDPEALLEMSRDQLNHLADEAELLQNDPEYFRNYVLEMKANISWDEGVSSSLK
jgi:hypothetical protein